MTTFIENLQFKYNFRIIKETFLLMAKKGINPQRFVDWYITDGILQQEQGVLIEATENWVKEELFLEESWFGGESGKTLPYIQQVKAANIALDNLSKTISKSKVFQNKINDPNFLATLLYLKKYLSDPHTIEKTDATTPSTTPTTPSTTPTTPSTTPSSAIPSFENFINNMRINLKLNELKRHGINPFSFVEWYIQEGQYLNEGLWQDIKDWGGRQWNNVKNAWNTWGASGQKWQDNVNASRNKEAIIQALNSLLQLKQGLHDNGATPIEDFNKVLDAVVTKLNNLKDWDGKVDVATPATSPAPVAPSPMPTVPKPATPSPMPTVGYRM